MNKIFCLLIINTLCVLTLFGSPKDSTHYQKGRSSIGLTVFPTFDMYYFDVGNIGFTVAPSYSYFIFKNLSVSGSFFYQNIFGMQNNSSKSTVNMMHASIFLRYYFWKSRFFFEGSYNYGFAIFKGSVNHKEIINNPGIGVGINGTFFENFGILTGKLSWEYSIKYRITTSYAPVDSYSSISRFAIVYHF